MTLIGCDPDCEDYDGVTCECDRIVRKGLHHPRTKDGRQKIVWTGVHRREKKRLMNWLMRRAGFGKYVIDCRDHPCRVIGTDFQHWGTTRQRFFSSGIRVVSLITDTPSACSLANCGIEPISEREALDMAAFAKAHTWEDYLVRYCGMDTDDLERYRELDKEWNFEKNLANR